jgi:TolA-binding protein
MKKIVGVLLMVAFLGGCGSSFKSSFNDFNAYYNTFYNAKKSFEQGVEKSESQNRKLNTIQPIRIYRTPMGAGSQDFQKAIDKGADILRKHDDTKWVDDALLIIGKSYFYRKEYFSADQKFEELILTTPDQELKQRAAFWKGRVLLELEAYPRGVQYLSEKQADYEGSWVGSLKSELQVILAEHYIARENYVSALDLLEESVGDLPQKEHKERGFFLMGQLYELLDNQEEAFNAYRKVGDFYTDYDLQFAAQKKRAEVARELGNTEEAYRVFNRMARDDKNTEFVSELNYELGKTEQNRGNFEKAGDIYRSVLEDRLIKPDAKTKALVYNGLAEVYRFGFNNFEMAAAYYDSAASLNINETELPPDFEAAELAESFGDYAGLKQEIAYKDSMLWLGTLPQAEFDSVIVALEQEKRAEFIRLQKEQEERRNTLVNVANANNDEPETTAENGFLNYKNPVFIADVKQQFKAIWGNRPLVDNWRFEQILEVELEATSVVDGDAISNQIQTEDEIFIEIDLSEVPFTPQEQDSTRELIATLNYQMGNLFFLSLNLSDSAEYYFEKVLEERPDAKVAPVTLYSLSELYSIENERSKAIEVAQELLDRFPTTIYSSRVIEKYELEIPSEIKAASVKQERRLEAVLADTSLSPILKADSLFSFSKNQQIEQLNALAHYQSIQYYVKGASSDSSFRAEYTAWNTQNELWDEMNTAFELEKDSAAIRLQDTTLTTTDSLEYATLVDSVLTKPDFTELFPYNGEIWDTTRVRIDDFISTYPASSWLGQVQVLKKEFSVPTVKAEEDNEPTQTDENTSEMAANTEYVNCTEINQTLTIRGGADAFLDTVGGIRDYSGTELTFAFLVNARGIVQEYQILTSNADESLVSSFEDSIESSLSFEPILVNGLATPVQCNYTFSID